MKLLLLRETVTTCSLKLQGKQSKQNTSPESYKTGIKILANLNLG